MKSFIEDILVSQDKDIKYRLLKDDLSKWIKALNSVIEADSTNKNTISLRFISSEEMRKINYKFRGVNSPTNVLAFPSELKGRNKINNLIGDIAICFELLKKEAEEQNKEIIDHLTHLFIHGALHLMGYKHENELEANNMESLERDILCKLGIDDPY